MQLADCVDLAFDSLPLAFRDSFANDAVAAIEFHLGLTVRRADHLAVARDGSGECDGMSFLEDGVVLFAPSPGSRRENFTLAHEIGHWSLEQADDAAFDWIMDQDNPAKVIETVCDRVAARLLFPGDAIARIVGAGPVRASHLIRLYDESSASRPACAIAMANRLIGLGAMVIIDRRSREVMHASVVPDPVRGWPRVFPWKKQTVSPTHPLMKIEDGGTRTRTLQWEMPWGASERFYADVAVDNPWTYVVLSAQDIWGIETFHPADFREFDQRPQLTGQCCSGDFTTRGYPCDHCQQPFCPNCGECRCDKSARREIACDGCYLRFLPHLLVGGYCENCR